MPKVAFLFPGQGAQAVGMGRELYRDIPAAKVLFDQAEAILGFDLKAICFDGPPEALEATDVSQPAIFVASLAALEGLKVSEPDVVAACEGAAGLSLGEYTALVF
ncbi:MAG TPA: acyltransferase domain-containing protein, partial [Isosphaeraceae bacterium]|nr:acyltransferase domain-containing protein [Isosphaeraceae bacterium]